jgi:outer membrane immunogenic protein
MIGTAPVARNVNCRGHRMRWNRYGEGFVRRLLAAGFVLAAMMAAERAAAADLSLAPLYKAAPPPVAVPYDWSGFYLGVNGGGGWGHSHWSATGTGFGVSGGQAGGTVGYNRQIGNVVFGVEGDIDWSGLNGTGSGAGCVGCSTSDSWLSTVRGRIGYAFDRVMPYATGGLAVGDIRAAMPGFSGGTSTNAGWTLGGGVEFALPGNWTAKAEYLRVDLGNFNCTGCTPAPSGNVSLQENVFRAGLNYRFGWGK